MVIVDVTNVLDDGKKPTVCWECPFFVGRTWAPEECVFKSEEVLEECPLVEIEYAFDDKPINNPKCSVEVTNERI